MARPFLFPTEAALKNARKRHRCPACNLGHITAARVLCEACRNKPSFIVRWAYVMRTCRDCKKTFLGALERCDGCRDEFRLQRKRAEAFKAKLQRRSSEASAA